MEETAIWEQHTVTLHRVSEFCVDPGAAQDAGRPGTQWGEQMSGSRRKGQLSSALLRLESHTLSQGQQGPLLSKHPVRGQLCVCRFALTEGVTDCQFGGIR